jgi:hypothetical protein
VTGPSDRNNDFLPRERLCQLAGVERGRHRRWLDEGLLPAKRRYGEIDLVKAAALDELALVLKPRSAKIVWLTIAQDLGIPGPWLEVVVRQADLESRLARSADELIAAMPRNEPVVVVSLHGRIADVRERLRAFRTRTSRVTRPGLGVGRAPLKSVPATAPPSTSPVGS